MKILISLIFAIYAASVPLNAAENPETRFQVTHYEVDIQSGLLAPIVWIYLQANNLNWDEVSIRTTFEKDAAGGEKVTEVVMWPDNVETENPKESDIVFRLSRDTHTVSFINFLNKTKFKEAEVPYLLDLFTYLFDSRNQEIRYETQNIFDNVSGNMRSRFNKKIDGDDNIVSVESINSSGNANGWIEVIMRSKPVKRLEKITARLKIGGIKVILTEIVKEEDD